MLAQKGLLSTPRNEWTTDSKNFLNGQLWMPHTKVSHPGLSDEDRSTFRPQVSHVDGSDVSSPSQEWKLGSANC